MANPSAQRQFLVKVSGIDGYFMTKSGGNISSDTTKVYDGGAFTPDVIASPPAAEDVRPMQTLWLLARPLSTPTLF